MARILSVPLPGSYSLMFLSLYLFITPSVNTIDCPLIIIATISKIQQNFYFLRYFDSVWFIGTEKLQDFSDLFVPFYVCTIIRINDIHPMINSLPCSC